MHLAKYNMEFKKWLTISEAGGWTTKPSDSLFKPNTRTSKYASPKPRDLKLCGIGGGPGPGGACASGGGGGGSIPLTK